MKNTKSFSLLECIGEIDNLFLKEAQIFNVKKNNAIKRKRMIKYGVWGAAGLAASVSIAALTYWSIRSRRMTKSA